MDDRDLPLLSYLYISCVFRHSSLLFSIWSAKGWGPSAFMAMLHPEPLHNPPTLADDAVNSSANPDRMSAVTGILRSDVSIILSQAHGPWLLNLHLQDRLETLQMLARMYSFLGFARKEAYIIRELVNITMDFVVGSKTASSFVEPGRSENNASESSTRDINSLLKLVKHVCSCHGIDLEAIDFVLEENHNTGLIKNRDARTQLSSSKREGWSELLADIAMESASVAESLSGI